MDPWERTSTRLLGDYRVFSLHEERLRDPRSGRDHTFFVVRTGDWVNVVALTPDRDVVLVRQHRAGTASVTLEIPGGMVDPGESPAEAARRELVEETGYDARELVPIGVVHPNPALFDNRCHTFLALDAVRAGDQSLDEREHIQVSTAPLAEIDGLIDAGDITHALVVAAFQHLGRYFSTGAGSALQGSGSAPRSLP